jgi:hypothetical protein
LFQLPIDRIKYPLSLGLAVLGNIVMMSNSTLYDGPFTNFTATERLSKKIRKQKNKPLKACNLYWAPQAVTEPFTSLPVFCQESCLQTKKEKVAAWNEAGVAIDRH